MQRVAGYNESQELTHLIEQLRERLSAESSPSPHLASRLEEVLNSLLVRNQQLRVLHRLTRRGGKGSTNEHVDSMRTNLEKLDLQLLQELPGLLEHWQERP